MSNNVTSFLTHIFKFDFLSLSACSSKTLKEDALKEIKNKYVVSYDFDSCIEPAKHRNIRLSHSENFDLESTINDALESIRSVIPALNSNELIYKSIDLSCMTIDEVNALKESLPNLSKNSAAVIIQVDNIAQADLSNVNVLLNIMDNTLSNVAFLLSVNKNDNLCNDVYSMTRHIDVDSLFTFSEKRNNLLKSTPSTVSKVSI